jgi:hypothetical protein
MQLSKAVFSIYIKMKGTEMIRVIWFTTWIIISIAVSASASEPTKMDGFGVAKWGMSKKDILAAEGPPTDNNKNTGEITYHDKIVMGKKAIVKYQFEAGCTDFDTTQCRFSEGQYIFSDDTNDFFEKIEEALTSKYGLQTNTTIKTKSYPGIATTGKCEIMTQTSERSSGQSSIKYVRDCSLYDFNSKITNKDIKAGTCRATIYYYGPYHYKTNLNRKKAQDMEL